MKKILLLLLLLNLNLFSQSWKTGKLQQTYNKVNAVSDAILDGENNLYQAGSFSDVYHGSGSAGVFISKTGWNGQLLWSDTIQNKTVCIRGLYFNDEDQICIAGIGENTFDVLGKQLNADKLHPGFSAVINTSGALIDATLLSYKPLAVCKAPDNTIAITGYGYIPTLSPDSTLALYFVGSFRDPLNCLWSTGAVNVSELNRQLITADDEGNIFVSEAYRSSIFKYSSAGTSSMADLNNITALSFIDGNLYVGYTDSTGHVLIFDHEGVVSSTRELAPDTYVSGIIRYNNSILVAGSFNEVFEYSSFNCNATQSGLSNLFLMEIKKEGDPVKILFARSLPEANACNYSEIIPCTLNSHGGEIFITGGVSGSVMFGSDTVRSCSEDAGYVFYGRSDWNDVSIVSEKDLSSLKIKGFFPARFVEKTTIDLTALHRDDQLSLTVYTPSGSLVLMTELSGKEYEMDRKYLQSGIYYYQLSGATGENIIEGRLVAQ